ncbi:tyrosine-protein phosphatase non-receptor type 6 [Purpureocillium lavendulum]|uniref:protein-tyrosine-phosphatase n=1 Tax=Purpureocillium lavendulum TaxID=1247861 RepID=A0AB34FK35_9HYPO|nr:tyrosine-protein phosphatase non-receptor type 6 [Purpureocillium lavendulum]
MKTHPRHSPSAGMSFSHTTTTHAAVSRPSKSNKSTTTPVASPRGPFSVGQNHPPRLSPSLQQTQRAPSPNYFGLVVESSNDPRESSGLGNNWSPGSSSVKSFGAALPKPVALDHSHDFEAFKRQADLNRGKSFSLPTAHYVQPTSNPAPVRPRPSRWHTHASDTGSEASFARPTVPAHHQRPPSKMDIDQDSLHDSAYVSSVSSDSKRNSESSMLPMQLTGLPRFESPRPMDHSHQLRHPLTRNEERDARLSMMDSNTECPSPRMAEISRADTLPPKLEPGAPLMMSGGELEELLETVDCDHVLLLDIRSSQNHAQSRIKGALNICVPTTLLKRPTFNIQKLQQTFHGGLGSAKFSAWKDMEWIVVYDSHASDKRDAVTAQNMIKKFTNEGFTGHTAILRGGFSTFQSSHPQLVEHGSAAALSNCNGRGGSGLAPVIGGVSLPQSGTDVNPFFSNIRQNMDLADGVGQLDISRPDDLDSPMLPPWLRDAASKQDHGKKVSDRFLHVELEEQARMKSAYAAFNPKVQQGSRFQLSGVEKGGKNRYKDILPFEHARVRLEHKREEGSCDYVNASHITASRSNKRYIASQGPLPATYEDFWSMIWEQDVRVIVMLTAESEGGQLKCHPYWKAKEFGPIRLRPLSEKKASLDLDKHRSDSHTPTAGHSAADSGRRRANTMTNVDSTASQSTQTQTDAPYVIIRKFALSHSAFPFAPIREVTHLHFPTWPDFGVPAQPAHLLALVELANVMQRAALPVETTSIVGSRMTAIDTIPVSWYDEPEKDSHCRPMLVHCSAGCGRTGTFCTVDSVIDMLKRQRQARLAAVRANGAKEDVEMLDPTEPAPPQPNQGAGAQGFFDFKPNREDAVSNTAAGDHKSPEVDTSWIQDGTMDLIQKTVEDFRQQRLSMVQSLRQYVLCYETVLEWACRMNDRTANTITGRLRSGSLQQTRSSR